MTFTPAPPPEGGGLGRVADMAALLAGTPPDDGPTLLFRSDGQPLLYPGALNGFHGEPGCGKTWLALLAAKTVIEAGLWALYIDYESTARAMAPRLAALGFDEASAAAFLYLQAGGMFTPADRSWLIDLVANMPIALVVFDSVGEALAPYGAESDAEVARWVAEVARPLARAGACVLVLDHVTKATENRGRWAIGSQRKLAAIDGASYTLDVGQPWARDCSGTARLTVAKDRRGHVGAVGAVAALVHVRVGEGGRRVGIDLGSCELADNDEPVQGTVRHVVAMLEESGGRWASVTEAGVALGLSVSATRQALLGAVKAGAVVEEKGERGAKVYHLPATDATREADVLDLETERRRRENKP